MSLIRAKNIFFLVFGLLLVLSYGCSTSNAPEDEHVDDIKNFEIAPSQLSKLEKGAVKVIDVRSEEEFLRGHVEGAFNILLEDISLSSLEKIGIRKIDEIVIYHNSGKRSSDAYKILDSLGFAKASSLAGGFTHWKEDGYEIVEGKSIITTPKNSATEIGPRISVDKEKYDFGTIPRKGGIVSTEFTIKNSGTENLITSSISTSCGCTSAEIKDEDVLPGEETTLTVFFDPDYHEEPQGKFTRTVFIESNDPDKEEIEVKILVDIDEDN